MLDGDLAQNFVRVYDQHADAIFRHIYFRIYDRELSKELMQETFTKTWEYLSTGKKIDNLKAFLYCVAKNLIVNFIRKNKAVSLEKLMEKGFQPAKDDHEKYYINLEAAKIISHLNGLPKQYAEVIKMRYLEDLSLKQIANILGKSENLVSVTINRGLNKLRKNLNINYEVRQNLQNQA